MTVKQASHIKKRNNSGRMNNDTKEYYSEILKKNAEFLAKCDKSKVPNHTNTMMEIRMRCIHLYLLKGAERTIFGDFFKRKETSVNGNALI